MVEIFIEAENKRFAVKCANSKSFLEAADEIDPGLKKLD
jgi:hypothetical protein